MRLQKLIVQFCILSLTFFMLTACESSDSDDSAAAVAVSLSSLSVTPASKSIGKGALTQLTATATYSNGTTADVTDSASWSSLDTSVVTVSDSTADANNPKGTVAAVLPGSTTVKATYQGKSGSSTVTVTPATLASVQVTPFYPSLALAATPEVQFTATGIYSDGAKLDLTEYATWSSSDNTIATVNNTAGKRGLLSIIVTTSASATITAVYQDISGNTTLTLTSGTVDSLEITPINPSIANDTTQQFTATALISDGTTQDLTDEVVWTSGTISVAPISNAADSMGLATAIATTSSTISANYEGTSPLLASDLTVTAATLNKIQIFPPAPSIAIGVDFQLTVKGVYTDGTVYTHQNLTDTAVWSSSDTDVAKVCNSSVCKGKVSALKAGTVTITASMPGPITKSINLTVNGVDKSLHEIQVTPTNPTIYSGTTQKFKATGVYTDNTAYFHEDITEKVVWSSSNETAAIVSNAAASEGVVRNRAAGTATITATLGDLSGTSALTILDSAIALTSIEVSPANPSIAEGMKQQFTAMGLFSDGTTTIFKDVTNEVIWTSGTATIARISNTAGSKGDAVSVADGTSVITATLGSTSGSSTLTVFDVTSYQFDSLQITPEATTVSIAAGAVQKLKAIGIFKTGANDVKKMDLTDSVTWISSDPAAATVDNLNGTSGQVRGLSAGSPTITAYWTDGSAVTQFATKSVVVSSSGMTLQSMQITPSNQSLDLDMTQQYTALGIYSDGSTYAVNHLPTDLTWLSADSSTSSTINAPIGSDYDNHGLARTLLAGTSTVSAQYDSKSATETLTTANVDLDSLTIYPANPTLANGTKQQFKAFGTYSDNINRDITHLVRWSSGTVATALIKNSPSDKGLATTISTGTSTITAALGSVSGTTTLTVEDGIFAATDPVQVTPSTSVMGVGTTLQLTATGIFNDGVNDYSVDLTGLVYWTTSDAAVVTVSNADGTNGRVYGASSSATPVTLTAYWTDTVPAVGIGTATVTVTSGSVLSIEVSPDQPSGPIGFTEQLKATALFSDNNTQDVTTSVVWTSSDKSIATVSNAEGSQGEITRISVGTATISARLGSNGASATVTVW